jgi:hypothetical protein
MQGIAKVCLGIALGFGLAVAPAARADKSYNSEENIKHDCGKDANVTINVADATVVFTGACNRITITGAENKVTIASVKKLDVDGAENTIHAVVVDEIDASGAGNKITYKKRVTGKTSVKSSGVGNKISEVQ